MRTWGQHRRRSRPRAHRSAQPIRDDSAGSTPVLRSPWHRRRDRLIAALLAVCCLVAGLLVWAYSDARATKSHTAPAAAPPSVPEQVPETLRPAWQTASSVTDGPLAVGSTVVTAVGGTVRGRDAHSGEVRWKYTRDRELCTVSKAWSKVLTVHRKGHGCSEVTQLDPATGQRTAQRNSNAPLGTRLVTDCHYPQTELSRSSTAEQHCGYVTATGTTLLNTWRDDLVRTVEYGEVPALVQPGNQPRPDCDYGTVASAAGKVGVIEQCPDDSHDRLTVYDAVPEEADEPEVVFSVELDRSGALLVAMSEESLAVAVPDTQHLLRFDMTGSRQDSYDMAADNLPAEAAQRAGIVPTAQGTHGVYWYTGSATVALDPDDMTPRWTLPETLGAGTMFAGHYVVPVENGIAVLDQDNGETLRTVAVDRGSHSGPVTLESSGSVLLEQRGDTTVALR